MITSILSFIVSHFSEALLVIALGMFSKALVKQFGNDRANKIKETILSAMLWAENQLGIGHGSQKWTAAWNKIIEMLQKQGIKLKNEEISYAKDLMKSNIPKINEITYNALPEKAKEARLIMRSPETVDAINKLKEKHKTEKE
ncbi:hypothetical protein ES695_14200 [Candidatus Atribacteria bacterium 1244-E10-H5-B2]|nr:MAG: hypothetical protein ES695_14200 [Candidatus Atribacteria bacterium 1244-E10-H5-B2]